MKDRIAILAKFISATNTRGARVSISVPEFKLRRVVGYDYGYFGVGNNAEVWLAEHGIVTDTNSPFGDCAYVLTTPRSSWKAIEAAFKI
jgi:hypothetical protein